MNLYSGPTTPTPYWTFPPLINPSTGVPTTSLGVIVSDSPRDPTRVKIRGANKEYSGNFIFRNNTDKMSTPLGVDILSVLFYYESMSRLHMSFSLRFTCHDRKRVDPLTPFLDGSPLTSPSPYPCLGAVVPCRALGPAQETTPRGPDSKFNELRLYQPGKVVKD